MGALAGLLHAAGHEVRGSDRVLYPPMSEQLQTLQIPVFEGFSPVSLKWGPDAVVVGNVCSKTHVEVVEAKRLGLPLVSLPATLASQFIAGHHSIVVAGSHGKTTTSALISEILTSAGRDPGFFIGGVPVSFGRGWRKGDGEEFIVEGDEYDSAYFDKGSKFFHYQPHTAVLTSVELDHVDIFASMDEVRTAFRKFVASIPADGLLLVCATSAEAMAIVRDAAICRVETYAVAPPEGETVESLENASATWLVTDVEQAKSGRVRFEVLRQGDRFDRYETLLVGDHNLANALAAVAVAHSRGLSREQIRRGLSQFAGVQRRLEMCGLAQGVRLMADYAHHPTAVTATLKALRQRFRGRRLHAIFEPRSATSRRKTFQREFAVAFRHADSVVVGPLYDPSRIPEDQRFDPERLALDVHKGGTPSSYIPDTDAIVAHVVDRARPGDVVTIFSSGAFDGLHDKLLKALGDAITPATPHDMEAVRRLLDSAGMNTSCACDDACRDFLVLSNEAGIVGSVALDVFGEDAVLRSLAVRKDARGCGYGWMLADTVIARARHRGVRRIYLFTETATDFFAAKLGFRIIDRLTVSAEVAQSPTFRDLTDEAIAMRLDL